MSLRSGQKEKKTSRSPVWKFLLWALLILIIGFALLLLWAWSQRFSIAEDQLRSRLVDEGISSEFSVTDLSEEYARVEGLVLSEDGKVFMRAESVEMTYKWRDLMDGKILAMTITRPVIDIAIGKNGMPDLNIIEARDERGAGSNVSFPPGGIDIKDGQAILSTPYGNIDTAFNGRLNAENDYELSLDIAPSRINYGDVTAQLMGPVKISAKDGEPSFDLDLRAKNWAYKELSGQGLNLSGNGKARLTGTGLTISGNYEAAFESFKGKAVQSGAGQIGWKGDVSVPRSDGGTTLARGEWQAAVSDIAMPDMPRRRKLARQIAIFEALSTAPVTRDFAVPVAGGLERLLEGASAQGSGRIDKDKAGMIVRLNEPIIWTNTGQSLTVSSREDRPFYEYIKYDDDLTLSFDAAFEGKLPMNFNAATLAMRSTNGRNVKGVKAFEADMATPRSWKSVTAEGRSVRLSPLKAKVAFERTDQAIHLKLNGRIDYDGDIPGGYVTGLKADGRLDVNRRNEVTKIYFTPAENSKVKMERFDFEAPWRAENVVFDLIKDPGVPLYIRNRSKRGQLSANVSALSSDIISTDEKRSMTVTYDQADITALIALRQEWDIKGRNIRMTSDTVPSAGTVMTAPQADMRVVFERLTPPEFIIDAPAADVITNMVEAKGLKVKASGIPEHFTVNYEDGQVLFTASDLPPVMLSGDVVYKDKIWRGDGVSFLPNGGNTPVDVSYQFKDGKGAADIIVPELLFTRRGLQPQELIPALRGKIADVEGAASAQIHVEFGDGQPMTSSGTAKLIEMQMGTLPGPFSGVNAELKFSSFFPLVTDGPQTLTIQSFDPGFPLGDGEFIFETIPDGVRILKAKWPLGSGYVSLDPTTWIYSTAENRMSLRIENVSLGEFMGNIAGENFTATGDVNGVLPVVISGVKVEVENGRLEVKNGGVIHYASAQTDAAGAENELAGYAFDALKEFHYKELEAIMNGPLDGTLILRMLFEGKNPNVLGGAVFRFNVTLEGELLNIARSFQLGGRIAEEIKNAIQSETEIP